MTRARHVRRLSGPVFALAVLLPCGVRDVAAQDGGGSVIQAARLTAEERIDLDGRVEESFWSRIEAISDFRQREPVEGGVPSHPTEVRVAYDRDNLYIAAILFDEPGEILARQRARDAFLFTDDRFAWVLDTFGDGRTGYHFETNAAGALSDGLITGTGGGGPGGGGGFGGVNRSWDGIWEVRTARRPDGWSAEIRIPFRTLNFVPNGENWGINFLRSIRRNNEEILWRGYGRNEGLNRLVFAGELEGLEGLSQGIGLEAVASGIGSWRNTPDNADPTTFPRDVSLDLNYSVTPSLRASFSVNTDFAEVESDQRRVNLTRFPLRFPERRDFFLEGSSVFTFAPRSGPQPFFSRRIGIEGGQQIPIDYGLRLTGQLNGVDLGFYQMGTGAHSYAPEDALANGAAPDPADLIRFAREAFTVARARVPIFEQSAIGAIYTRRSTAADANGFLPADRHTLGADLDYRTNSLFGNQNFEAEAFMVWNSNPDPAVSRSFQDLSAWGGRINFPNDLWSGHVSYREFGDDYSPAVGFVARNDFRRVEPRIGWAPRPAIDWIRQVEVSVQLRNLWEMGSMILEEQELQLNFIDIDFESGDNLSFEAVRTYEFLDRQFEISDGIDIVPGDYTTWDYRLRGRTTSRRPVSVRGGANFGGFWNGDRVRVDLNANFRPNPGINLETGYERNAVYLPQGDFVTNLYRLEGSWDPTPWIGVTNQFQYDDVSRVLGLFMRFRWILKPGNDLFLVYTHNWRNLESGLLDAPDDSDPMRWMDLRTLSRGASIKLNYTYRF
ncbi:MAG: carbohydrate binding family 9 domain-containing protein [Gemmatimonadales bacterium]|nr:carbohydrate binding family 9 domain-containing protein [Candidatus Palauibacter irciniicola]MYC19837.1 carbohydrate binding family 9 domain-containing protein [Gemmatimonadales bacterium]